MAVTQERKNRINRERTHELDKFEVYRQDSQVVDIDTRLLNKLARKMGRRRSQR